MNLVHQHVLFIYTEFTAPLLFAAARAPQEDLRVGDREADGRRRPLQRGLAGGGGVVALAGVPSVRNESRMGEELERGRENMSVCASVWVYACVSA